MMILGSNSPPNSSKAKSKMGWSWSECGVNKMWRQGRGWGGQAEGWERGLGVTGVTALLPCDSLLRASTPASPSAWNAFLSP